MNPRELPLDRIATADAQGRRIYLYPTDVKGRFRSMRSAASLVLLVVFLVLPWLRIGGNPAVLLDIPGRKFSVLGLMFWAHDAPMLFFVIAGAAVTLAFLTAVWGRVWCGWACPQTVFVDSVYRRIERLIEGDAVERRRLDEAPWSASKVAVKSLKWTAFALVSLVIGHSFLAYFTGTEALAAMMASSPARNPASFAVMALVSGGVLFDFGWFREQFCTMLCPYGRLQSVLMDDRSMVVAYDAARGEPRRGVAAPGLPVGDCVNCYKCVTACPTGIDIRRGVQLECIACTACIDACDDVMARLKKPAGLIRYAAQSTAPGARVSWRRPRALAYLAILAALATGLALTVRARKDLSADFIRAIGAPYQVIRSDAGRELVVNQYRVDLRNQSFEPRTPALELPEELRARGAELVLPIAPATLAPGQTQRLNLAVRFPKELLVFGRAAAAVLVRSERETLSQEVKLVGPLQ